jgi:hypothetical protein
MITYYSDIKDSKSISNPLMDNSANMRYSGFFDVVKNDQTPYFGTSLKKTLHNQGRIFCEDTSQLFDISAGYVGLVMSLSGNIHNGILNQARFSQKDYMLWGVNMGETDIVSPGIGVFFTKNGIEFRVKTSGGNYTLTDTSTTIIAEKFFEIEFLWNKDGITVLDEDPTMVIRVNNDNIIGGIIPIVDDLNVNSAFYTDIGQSAPSGSNVFSDMQFQVFDNIHKLNNLPCSISRIMVEDSIPLYFS